MDQEQLNAIKERVAKATLGPWKVVKSEETGVQVGTTWESGQLKNCVPIVTTAHGVEGVTIYINDNNSNFIAHAREDVPALVGEVEYLRGMLRDTRKIVRQKVKEVKTLQNACKNHKAKQEALEFHLKVSIHHAEELDVELEAEITENEQLRKALEFYAEETKYERVELCDGDKEIYIERDGGEIARQALKGEARI